MVRFAHEALLSQWPLAHEIIAANREFLATRSRVRADARRWLAGDKNPDLLLPAGKRLAEAEDVLLTRREEIDDKTIGYIEASISAQRKRLETEEAAKRERLELEADAAREQATAARRLAHRTRIAAIITLVLAIAAGAGAIVGFSGQQEATQQAELAEQNAAQARAAEQDATRQATVAEENAALARAAEQEAERQAQEAERQAQAAVTARDGTLVNQSLFLASLSAQRTGAGDTTTGILLALEGLPSELAKPDRPYVAEAEAALYSAVFARREIAVLGHRGAVYDARFSPQGNTIATASADQTAGIWDVTTGRAIASLRGHRTSVQRIAFSPDGSRIATASQDHTARLWDATTGREVAVMGALGRVWHVAFSPDGARIVTSSDGGAQLWDADTGDSVTVSRVFVRWADFSPDGNRLVTVGADRTARVWGRQRRAGDCHIERT